MCVNNKLQLEFCMAPKAVPWTPLGELTAWLAASSPKKFTPVASPHKVVYLLHIPSSPGVTFWAYNFQDGLTPLNLSVHCSEQQIPNFLQVVYPSCRPTNNVGELEGNMSEIQSYRHHQQTNTQLFKAGCPSCRPTNSV